MGDKGYVKEVLEILKTISDTNREIVKVINDIGEPYVVMGSSNVKSGDLKPGSITYTDCD